MLLYDACDLAYLIYDISNIMTLLAAGRSPRQTVELAVLQAKLQTLWGAAL